jgi:hypothetical protein
MDFTFPSPTSLGNCKTSWRLHQARYCRTGGGIFLLHTSYGRPFWRDNRCLSWSSSISIILLPIVMGWWLSMFAKTPYLFGFVAITPITSIGVKDFCISQGSGNLLLPRLLLSIRGSFRSGGILNMTISILLVLFFCVRVVNSLLSYLVWLCREGASRDYPSWSSQGCGHDHILAAPDECVKDIFWCYRHQHQLEGVPRVSNTRG